MRRLSPSFTAALLLSLASGAQAAGRHRLDLPGGRLGEAIVVLGRQAGVNIGVSDPLLAAQPVPAVSGTLTVEQALRRMLRGPGASYVEIDPHTFRIVREPAGMARRSGRQAPTRAPAPAVASAAGETEPQQEIIVTGARRLVRISAYPGAVEIVPGDDPEFDLAPRGSEAIVARLPSVASTYLGPGRNKLFIRGIADSSFTGPTQATAGQYLGETRLNYNAPDPDLRLYDLERIEVLQGPQGTLYGAGSLGGIIRILPNRPRVDRTEGSASLGLASTEHGDPSGDSAAMFNLPLIEDRLALRAVAYAASEGGYIDDSGRGIDDVNRVRTIGGRGALRLVTDSELTVDLGTTVQHIDGEDGQFADRKAAPLTRNSALDQPFSSDYLLSDLVVSKYWGDIHLVTSLGAVRQKIDERYDSTGADTVPQVFVQQSRITLLSAESRLSGGGPDGPSWLIGTSLIRNEARQRRGVGSPDAPVPIPGVRNGIQEAALFGEGSIGLAPGITATAGARLSHSRLSGEALDAELRVLQPLIGERAQRNQTAFLPSIALSADAAPGLLFFARYQESFRPGGLSITDTLIRRFRNDDVWTVEGGIRYGQPGRDRFDAAASIAYTRWNDIQADTISLSGFPTTANIGNGRIYTLDLHLGWRPIDALSLDLSGVINDSRVTNPLPTIDISGDAKLPNVADFNGRFGVDYRIAIGDALDLRLNAVARYIGESRLGIGPVLGREQGDWLDLSLGARVDRGAHSVSLSLTNLLDEVGNRFAMGSPFTLVVNEQVTPLRPRTLRLGWQLRF